MRHPIQSLKISLRQAGFVNVDILRAGKELVVRYYTPAPDGAALLGVLDPILAGWHYTVSDVYSCFDVGDPYRRYCQVRIQPAA